MKTFFDEPTQVIWCDSEGSWEAGIATGGYVICMCCGAMNPIEDIIEDAPEDIKDPIRVLPWVNVSEEIGGDALIEANMEIENEE